MLLTWYIEVKRGLDASGEIKLLFFCKFARSLPTRPPFCLSRLLLLRLAHFTHGDYSPTDVLMLVWKI